MSEYKVYVSEKLPTTEQIRRILVLTILVFPESRSMTSRPNPVLMKKFTYPKLISRSLKSTQKKRQLQTQMKRKNYMSWSRSLHFRFSGRQLLILS